MTRAALERFVRVVPGYVAVALCVAAAIWGVSQQWSDVVRALATVSIGDLLGAGLLGFVALLVLFLSWRSALTAWGVQAPARDALAMYGVGQLGKYLPGAVWPVVAQARMGRRLGIPQTQMASGAVLALGISVGGALALGCLLLPLAGDDAVELLWWAPILAIGLLAMLSPPVLNALVPLADRLTGRRLSWRRTTWRGTLSSLGWCWVGNLAFGAHLFVLGGNLGMEGARGLALGVAAYALASALGVVVVFAPAGIGVREIVLILVLAPVATTAGAVTLALLSRVLLVVADLTLGLVQLRRLHQVADDGERRVRA